MLLKESLSSPIQRQLAKVVYTNKRAANRPFRDGTRRPAMGFEGFDGDAKHFRNYEAAHSSGLFLKKKPACTR
jgi:hypothetical protein